MGWLMAVGAICGFALLMSGTAFGGRRAQLGFSRALAVVLIGLGAIWLADQFGPQIIVLIVAVGFIIFALIANRNSN